MLKRQFGKPKAHHSGRFLRIRLSPLLILCIVSAPLIHEQAFFNGSSDHQGFSHPLTLLWGYPYQAYTLNSSSSTTSFTWLSITVHNTALAQHFRPASLLLAGQFILQRSSLATLQRWQL